MWQWSCCRRLLPVVCGIGDLTAGTGAGRRGGRKRPPTAYLPNKYRLRVEYTWRRTPNGRGW
uniref:Secreted protein n=1 Tax=Oryza sativa subsp. japonica TaxID=39947 RepID=Q6ERV2_ORYSJ|nr:hypothetical protein [Oryza sativa Japonica Group]BAD28618.1 hypothetical protein [Oryza sativa Japonica Group]